jgi:hypothetical protein
MSARAPVSDALLRRTSLTWYWDYGGWEVHDDLRDRIVARIKPLMENESWLVELCLPAGFTEPDDSIGDRRFGDLEAAAAWAEVHAYEIDGEELPPHTQDIYLKPDGSRE